MSANSSKSNKRITKATQQSPMLQQTQKNKSGFLSGAIKKKNCTIPRSVMDNKKGTLCAKLTLNILNLVVVCID